MKKQLVVAAALAFLAGTAMAANHTGHDSSPPAMRVVQTDRVVKHDTTTTDKKGTTQSGSMTHTQTTPKHGTKVISHHDYHHHTPSDMAVSNDKKWESSIGLGGSYSFAKDSYDARISDMGLAAGMQFMWRANPHLAFGLDYTMMAPQHRSNNRGGHYDYKNLRAHHMSVAGKYTINAWDKINFYIPMGVGASKISLKGSGIRDGVASSQSDSHWGVSLYAGLGMQYTLTDDLFLGVEYRYYMPFIKTNDLNDYGKDRYMDFHGAFLRLGMRF